MILPLLAQVQFSYLLEVTLKTALVCDKFSSIKMLIPKTHGSFAKDSNRKGL